MNGNNIRSGRHGGSGWYVCIHIYMVGSHSYRCWGVLKAADKGIAKERRLGHAARASESLR